MTVQNQPASVSYVPQVLTQTFAFNFKILSVAEVRVTVEDEIKVLNTDYTVENLTDSGGDIVFVNESGNDRRPLPGSTVLIARKTVIDQQVVYNVRGPFPAKTHEGALDKNILISQELSDRLDRLDVNPTIGVLSFNGRTGAVVPLQSDYEQFYTLGQTPREIVADLPVVDPRYPEGYAVRYGLEGNDTDETDVLTKLFSISGIDIVFEFNKTYRTTSALPVKPNSSLDLNGSTLKFVVTGSADCLQPESFTKIFNGTIELAGSGYTGNGSNGCPVIIGDFGGGPGFKNIKVHDVIVKSNKNNGNGIMVTGDSHNIDIERIIFDSASLNPTCVLVHWGGATTPSNGTTHPHNIRINDIKATNVINYSVKGQGVISLSGCYNIKTSNVDCHNVSVVVDIYPGDFGRLYATPEVARKIGFGIDFENITATGITEKGADVTGLPLSDPTVLKNPFTIRNFTFEGAGASNGLEIRNTDRVRIVHGDVSGFQEYGVLVGRRAHYGTIRKCDVYNNGKSGVYGYDDVTPPTYWNVNKSNIYSNNTGSNVNPFEQAGIGLRDADYWTIRDNTFGVGAGETQAYGIRAEAACRETRVWNNYALGASIAAYSFGSTSDYAMRTIGDGNTASAAVPTVFAGSPIFRVTNTNNLEFMASAPPASGVWTQGDRCWNTVPTASTDKAMGWVYVSAWEPFGDIGT